MKSTRPYTHILKNLFHEQATEIIPLLWPGYQVKQVLDVEMPELRSIEVPGPPSGLAEGLVGLAMPGAKITKVYQTEWIEHSGRFERTYRIKVPETNKPSYLVVELQIEHEDKDVSRNLLGTFAHVNVYVSEDVVPDESDPEQRLPEGTKGTLMNKGYYIYPYVLCMYPDAVPPPINETFQGEPIMSFNFFTLKLWEKDAREFLNIHASPTYFLLPMMKNADAALLGLAIDELVAKFQGNDAELGRHLTGMSLLLQQSQMLSDAEKSLTQEHLKPFSHLIKTDPLDE